MHNYTRYFTLIIFIFLTIIVVFSDAAAQNGKNTTNSSIKHRPNNDDKKFNSLLDNLNSFQSFDAPKVEFRDEFNNNYILKAFKGKKAIIYFWASWCSACLEDLRSLDILKANLLYKDATNIEIIPISVDFKSLEEIRQSLRANQLKNLVLFEDKHKHLYGQLRVKSIPTTFIVNSQGRIIFGFEGNANFDSQVFEQFILNLN
jgi:thiol-disulfide isomerase/thioredoxin